MSAAIDTESQVYRDGFLFRLFRLRVERRETDSRAISGRSTDTELSDWNSRRSSGVSPRTTLANSSWRSSRMRSSARRRSTTTACRRANSSRSFRNCSSVRWRRAFRVGDWLTSQNGSSPAPLFSRSLGSARRRTPRSRSSALLECFTHAVVGWRGVASIAHPLPQNAPRQTACGVRTTYCG